MKSVLDSFPQYRDKLYIRGFLLTDDAVEEASYPFYNVWKRHDVLGKTLLVHPQQNCYVRLKNDMAAALVGHAYNPIALEADENQILLNCLERLDRSEKSFWNYYNELTGVFTFFLIRNNTVWIVDDASGMQTTFYTTQRGKLYVSSHTMLLGEMLGLKKDPYVERLTNYRFFPLLGNSLPADLTQFVGLKRITPNFCCTFQNGTFTNRRFFSPYQIKGKSCSELAQEAGQILNNSLALIAKKWTKPAISLTGGCDSKTTLACANGLYDQFRYYSYCSTAAEKIDCNAAAEICKSLKLQHKVYPVPERMPIDDHEDVVAQILRWNCGDLLDSNPNDIRKRIVLDKLADFDVEIKSWASEIGRAYYSKRFCGRTKFPEKPTGRACTTLYKFFFHDRKLVKETDKIFERFIQDYYEPAKENPIEWFEQFFWEFRVPAWNGLVITGEHRYSSDITIPYNNRILLTLFLSVPLEDRITDSMHTEIRKRFNPVIDATGIAVTNLKHTNRRAQFENLYWILHSSLPL